MVTNRRLVEKAGPNFYPTPAWGTIALLHHVTFHGSILEPCCGKGAMSEELIRQYGPDRVMSSDKYDYGYGEVKDFFDIQKPYDNVVTNPPYNIAEDILYHALHISNKKVALLLRLAFLEGQKRYYKIFQYHPPSEVLVFSERLSMYPDGYPVKSGGTTSYGWFIWEKRHNDISNISHRIPPNIRWIAPGFKNKE